MNDRRRFLFLLVPLVCAGITFPAARSDAADGAPVSATEVAEGLATIQVIAGDVVSAAADKPKATMIAEGIDPIWSRIEATIKANDANSYTTMEKGLDGLVEAAKAGDAAKAGGSAGVIASAVKFYVAKFPGDGRAAAAAAESRAAAAPAESRAAAAPAERKAAEPSPAEGRTAAAADGAAPAADAPAAAEGGTLARTGGAGTLTAVAGGALGLGGLAFIGGARRRRSHAA